MRRLIQPEKQSWSEICEDLSFISSLSVSKTKAITNLIQPTQLYLRIN